MKTYRNTAIFALVVASLIGFAVWDSRNEQKKSAAQAEKERIVPVKVDEVSEVRVERDSETMVIKRGEGKWLIVEPLQDEAENETMTAYLEAMTLEKGATLAKPKSGARNWGEYFLEPPGAKVSLKRQDGTSVEFSIARLAAFDGSYFIRRGDDLILGSTNWARTLEKTAAQLRNRKLVRAPGEMVKIAIESRDAKVRDRFSLVKKDQAWHIVEAAQMPVSSDRVQSLIEDLRSLRALDFVAASSEPAIKKKYGLDKPVSIIRIEYAEKDKGPLQIEISAEKEGAAYAVSSAFSAVVKLALYDAEKFHLSRNRFRDGKKPFSFNMELARKASVKSGKEEIRLEKSGEKWQLVAGSQGGVLDEAAWESFITKVAALEAKAFDQPKSRMKTLRHRFELQDQNGKVVFLLKVGEEYDANDPKVGEQKLVAVQAGTEEVFAVGAESLSAIPWGEIMKKDTQPAAGAEQR